MIIYIAPKDGKLRSRTLEFAKKKEVRMVDVDDNHLIALEEANKAPKFRYADQNTYNFGDAETIWIVGHGNGNDIGDEKGGVTITAQDLVNLLTASVIVKSKDKYHGSIVIDTCDSAIARQGQETFADKVYKLLKKQLPNVTVGGWKGDAYGPISSGRVEFDGKVLKGDAGSAWAEGKAPDNVDHGVLGNLT